MPVIGSHLMIRPYHLLLPVLNRAILNNRPKIRVITSKYLNFAEWNNKCPKHTIFAALTLAPYTGLGIVGFGLCGFAFFILTAEIVVENVRRFLVIRGLFSLNGQQLDSLLLGSLMFLRRRCEGWSLCFMLFLLFKPTAIATSGKECLEDDGSSLNYNGKCNKFNVDLETDDESLSIKMDYAKDIVAAMEPFTMTLGGCDITGKISNKNGDGSFIRESTSARLPTTFQVSKDKITYGAGIAISCSVKFESMGEKGGFKVAVKYNPDKDLPGLRLTFDAKIFTPTEKADYSHFIYIFIAIVVVALVVKLLAIVCWYCRKRRARARNQEPNASKPTINANLGTEAQAPNVA